MGWSLKRAFHNPLSLAFGPIAGGFPELDPGPNGNDPKSSQLEYRDADRVRWDPLTGMPINVAGPPSHELALKYQYRAQEIIRRRQQALWGDAQGALASGQDLLQSYRPGGSAALASGIFGQQANLYAAQAQHLEEPDLLSQYRENSEIEAKREAKRNRNIQIGLGVLQAGVSMATLGLGGAAMAPVAAFNAMGTMGAAAMAASRGDAMAVPRGPGYETVFNRRNYPGLNNPAYMNGPTGVGAPPPIMGPEPPPAPLSPGQYGPTDPSARYQEVAPSLAPGRSTPGFPGQPGGGGKAPGLPGAPTPGGAPGQPPQEGAGTAQAGAARGQMPSPQLGVGYGGLGQDGLLSGPALAGGTMRAAPDLERVVVRDLAEDRGYAQSTYLRVSSARSRLMAALAG